MDIIGTYLAYRMIKLLSSQFSEWTAYDLGLIDETGEIIRKPVLSNEKKAFGMFERMILKIKKAISKLVGNSKAAAIFTTLLLLKEHMTAESYDVFVEYLKTQDEDFNKYMLEETYKKENKYKAIFEEIIKEK